MTPLAARARRGFTLVEVAVTIVIVGIGLTLVLQAMNTATTSAAQTRNMKIARELGLLTLGRIKSGLYQEEVRDRFYGSYAEDEFPEFEFEVLLGDEAFDEQPDANDPDRPFDNFRAREERLAEEADATDEDEEAT